MRLEGYELRAYKVMKYRSFAVIVIAFLLFSTALCNSSLLYEKTSSLLSVGVLPIPEEWVKSESENYQIVKFIFSPSFYVSQWPSHLMILADDWIGQPTNPAQSSFYLQDEIPPLFKLVIDWKFPNAGVYLEIPFEKESRNKLITLNSFNNFPFSITNPLDLSKLSIDLNFPKFSYIYYANDWLFAAIGRFPLKWGDAQYPVHISPTIYQDNFTMSIKTPTVSYTFHAIASYPLLSNREEDIQKHFSDQHTAGKYFTEPSKYIFAHRIDFVNEIFTNSKLRIGLGELNIVGGKFPDIIDLNPVVIYHNTYGEGFSNVTGSIDFTLLFSDVIKIYGEYVLDDIIGFTEVGSNYKPGADAKNIGVSININNQKIWAEYSETSEWMYVTNYLPYLKINVRHFELQNNPSGRFLVDYPLGFIYGPDAKMLSVGINGILQDLGIKYDITYNYLIKGLVNDNGNERWKWFWDGWPHNVSEPGSSTPEKSGEAYYQILSTAISWRNFTLFYKTVNLEQYIFGLKTGFSF
jgi:hypothetical protein